MKRLAKMEFLTRVPRIFARPAVFVGHEDPSHPYGQWSLLVEPDGGHYAVCFIVPDAPHEWLERGATFTMFNGSTPIAYGKVIL